MTARYLLDTNIISDLMRNPAGRVADHIKSVGETAICTSIIVAAELRFGAAKRKAPALETLIENILATMPVFAFEAPADRHYAALRTGLEARGRPIGAHDLLLAAHAQALDCTMVTHNTREFSNIPDLRVEDWLI